MAVEVALLTNFNQGFSSSLRLLACTAQLDAKLIAFCTILTVAFSIIFSFKQSRYFILHSHPISNVKKYLRIHKTCLRCIKCGLKSLKGLKNNLKGKVKCAAKYSKKTSISCCCYVSRKGYSSSKSTVSQLLKLRRLGPLFRPLTPGNAYLLWSFLSMITKMKNLRMFRRIRREGWSEPQLTKINANIFIEECFDQTNNTLVTTCEANYQQEDLSVNLNTQDVIQTQIKMCTKVRLYRRLPLKSMSRVWGTINSLELPVYLRKPFFHFYSWMFSCNLAEMDIEDLTQFKNLSEFFRRALKPDVRVIDQYSCLISPCDGTVLHYGKVKSGHLEQVKGVTYTLQSFLGKQTWPKPNGLLSTQDKTLDDEHQYEKSILTNPNNSLFHCVIYLAPGDYHRFHSPAEWQIYARRHFPGELFSVNPAVVKWLKGILSLNERAVYYGQWKYGFFSMTPVGATNVGSIKVYSDDELITNSKNITSETLEHKLYKDFCSTTASTETTNTPSASIASDKSSMGGIEMRRGEPFGEFNLGSTIVLIFEAPSDFKFDVKKRTKVYYGQELGSSESGNVTRL